MSRRLDWNSDGARWPNRQYSRFVAASGLTWHVQVMGEGPVLLLLHGTGASSHSFRDLAPLLAKHFTVVVPDLPGHSFTSDGGFGKLSLDGMALALGELLRALGLRPVLGVGHSAGAAVLLRMDIDELIAPELIVSLNGALQPFPGLAGQVFAPIARMLALMPVVPGIFAWRASDPNVVDDLLKRTGSKLDPDGVAQYCLLAKNAAHVGAALGMMASWDLPGLKRDLGKVRARVLLVSGALDEMVPPSDGVTSQGDISGSQLVRLKGLGHLAHEEQPGLVARLIEDAFNARPLQLSAAEGRDMGAANTAPAYLSSPHPARGPRALASGTRR
jgi:magnesium chelatase accessory protein